MPPDVQVLALPDFISSDTIPAPLTVDATERYDWVEMMLAQKFMQDAQRSMAASLAVTWIMAAVMYSGAAPVTLALWLGLINAVILTRYLVIKQYQTSMQGIKGFVLRRFLARYDVLWTLAGAVWGASTALFYAQSSGFEQFICTLILIGVCCISVYSYAARLQCFFSFVNALCGTVLLVYLYTLVVLKAVPWSIDSASLIALDAVFFLMLRYFGVTVHRLHRHSLQLQFDNSALVQSLTAKSAAAMEAVQNKNRFIASAAHDLRQPVHALNLYASWLVDEPELSPQVAPQIVRCTNAVNELFDSLFDFSGLNADMPQVQWQRVDLAELLVDLQAQYAPLALERGLVLRVRKNRVRGGQTSSTRSSFSRSSGSAWSDPVLLKRLLGNFISNALKNTAQGGVLLALRWRAGRWRIEVWDTGVGIELQYQQAIFQEFYRVPRPGTEDGFGLGLAIARRLAQLLGHTLHMRSAPGRGSVFWIEQDAGAALPGKPLRRITG